MGADLQRMLGVSLPTSLASAARGAASSRRAARARALPDDGVHLPVHARLHGRPSRAAACA
jgi:hypothetical protein